MGMTPRKGPGHSGASRAAWACAVLCGIPIIAGDPPGVYRPGLAPAGLCQSRISAAQLAGLREAVDFDTAVTGSRVYSFSPGRGHGTPDRDLIRRPFSTGGAKAEPKALAGTAPAWHSVMHKSIWLFLI